MKTLSTVPYELSYWEDPAGYYLRYDTIDSTSGLPNTVWFDSFTGKETFPGKMVVPVNSKSQSIVSKIYYTATANQVYNYFASGDLLLLILVVELTTNQLKQIWVDITKGTIISNNGLPAQNQITFLTGG